jgi:hypothetical protein
LYALLEYLEFYREHFYDDNIRGWARNGAQNEKNTGVSAPADL